LGQKRRGAGRAAYDGLTARQRQVLTLVAKGFSNRQISEKLDISIHTVQRHRANIRRQLDLDGGVDLVKYALRKGLIQLDEDQ
jgi:two-component system response regulator NreC